LRRTRTQRSGSADKLLFSQQKRQENPWEQKTPPKRKEREKALTTLIEPEIQKDGKQTKTSLSEEIRN